METESLKGECYRTACLDVDQKILLLRTQYNELSASKGGTRVKRTWDLLRERKSFELILKFYCWFIKTEWFISVLLLHSLLARPLRWSGPCLLSVPYRVYSKLNMEKQPSFSMTFLFSFFGFYLYLYDLFLNPIHVAFHITLCVF